MLNIYLYCTYSVLIRAATSNRVLKYSRIRPKESSTNNHHFRNCWIAIFVRNITVKQYFY